LSGSSDGTIRLWSIGQQQCIATVRVHSGGVWTLQSDDNFSSCFSAGKDHCVYYTDLLRTEESVLVCEENAPILKICLMPDRESLWISTSDSDIKNWVSPT
jgi:WD repeat-containing protein 48